MASKTRPKSTVSGGTRKNSEGQVEEEPEQSEDSLIKMLLALEEEKERSRGLSKGDRDAEVETLPQAQDAATEEDEEEDEEDDMADLDMMDFVVVDDVASDDEVVDDNRGEGIPSFLLSRRSYSFPFFLQLALGKFGRN